MLFRFFVRSFIAALVLVLGVSSSFAQQDDTSPHSDAELVTDRVAVQPGESFDVALRIDMEEGWHSYWLNAGDSGLETRIRWDLPEGVAVGDIRWPFPERVDTGPFTTYAYHDIVYLLSEVTIPQDFQEDVLSLSARANWLICADICLPAHEDVAINISIGEDAGRTEWADAVDEFRNRLPVELPDGWAADAEATDEGYLISVAHPNEWTGDASGIELFAAEGGVIRHAARHVVTPFEDGFTINVERSEFARGVAPVFKAVLVADESSRFVDDAQAIYLELPVSGAPEEVVMSADIPAVPFSVGSIWMALVFAFIGGMILNLMPCVFPILSIKILGFAEGNSQDRGTMRKHGLLFGAGVILSFLVLAGALLLLRAGGESLGWGFQLQNPLIIALLALLMFVIGLNLLGMFEVGFGLAGTGGRLDRGSGSSGAFWSGVLATIVATPCTAPFMGAALGWSLAQPAMIALLVFAMLGVGMAVPYVLLSFFPRWLERLPKPGPWMETLKQALSFGLFATAVWLVWVFGRQTGVDGAALLLFAMMFVGIAIWMIGRWPWITSNSRTRIVTRSLAGIALVLALTTTLSGSRLMNTGSVPVSDGWQTFDPDRIEELVQAGQPVFVDFTATWCITCQVNKRVALTNAEVIRKFDDRNVARMQADWTNYDPVITEALESFGRSGVPLYVLYPGGNADPVILPELLTPGIVINALDRISPATASLP